MKMFVQTAKIPVKWNIFNFIIKHIKNAVKLIIEEAKVYDAELHTLGRWNTFSPPRSLYASPQLFCAFDNMVLAVFLILSGEEREGD